MAIICEHRKVLLLTNFAESLILFRLSLLNELKSKGFEVVACAPDLNQNVVTILNGHGIRFVKLSMDKSGINPFVDFYSIIQLYKLLKKEKPTMLLNYTVKPTIYGSLAGFFAGVPKIFSFITGFGSVFIGETLKIKGIRCGVSLLYKAALKFNKKVFVLNPDILKFFVQEKKILPQDKAVLINGEGLDINYYQLVALPESNFPVFLMIARVIKDKGIYEYIEAARLIKKEFPKVRFLLVGFLDSNPTAISKGELAALIGDAPGVEYLGKMDDVRDVIKTSSVYVLPSYAEGIPRSTLEAMSMGRPVITTDAPGCRETVVEGVNGFLVPVKNVEKLADAMKKYILNPGLMLKMGKESRRLVEEKYDVNKVNKTILGSML